MNLLGGKIDEIGEDETAYSHRKAIVSAEYYLPLHPSASNAQIDTAQAKQNGFRQVYGTMEHGWCIRKLYRSFNYRLATSLLR